MTGVAASWVLGRCALALPKISEGNSAASNLIIRKESPWDTFEKFFECDLAGTVAVCVRRSGRRAVWAVRQYPSKHADKVLGILRSIRHKNVVSVVECFHTSNSLYTLGKHQPLTLELLSPQIDCCSIRPPGKVQLTDLAPVGRDDGAVGPDNLNRWRSSSAAIEFLSATTSASSLEEVKKG
ncbi:hypothetical protein BDW75DRAFT_234477 [Aspergillus navahoensis]